MSIHLFHLNEGLLHNRLAWHCNDLLRGDCAAKYRFPLRNSSYPPLQYCIPLIRSRFCSSFEDLGKKVVPGWVARSMNTGENRVPYIGALVHLQDRDPRKFSARRAMTSLHGPLKAHRHHPPSRSLIAFPVAEMALS